MRVLSSLSFTIATARWIEPGLTLTRVPSRYRPNFFEKFCKKNPASPHGCPTPCCKVIPC